jgi:hypothetical protein
MNVLLNELKEIYREVRPYAMRGESVPEHISARRERLTRLAFIQ